MYSLTESRFALCRPSKGTKTSIMRDWTARRKSVG